MLLIALVDVSSGRMWSSTRRTNTLRQIFNEMNVQKNLNGFFVYQKSYGRKIRHLDEISKQCVTSMAKIASVLSVNSRVNPRKFIKPYLNGGGKDKVKLAVPGSIKNKSLLVSDKCLPVWLLSIHTLNNYDVLSEPVFVLLGQFRVFLYAPKLLITIITHKNNLDIRIFLHNLFEEVRLECEVMVVTVNGNRSKRMVLNYKVHQLNYFSRRYSALSYRPGRVRWFYPKTKNLHKFVLWMLIAKLSYFEGSLQGKSQDKFGALLLAVKIMNGSTDILRHDRCYDLVHPTHTVSTGDNMISFVKPNEMRASHMIVPIIYDQSVKIDYSNFFRNLTIIVSITLIFVVWSWLFRFDSQTWRFLTIVEMVIGNGNARVPVVRSEAVAFACIVMIGFFSGSDLTSRLTTVFFLTQTERLLDSFDNLSSNNIFVIVSDNPHDYADSPLVQSLLRSNVKYVSATQLRDKSKHGIKKLLETLIVNRNISMSTGVTEKFDVKIPGNVITIGRNRTNLAKVSNIKEYQEISAWFLYPINPFVERLSDIYWRIIETSTVDHLILTGKSYDKRRYNLHGFILDETLRKLEQDIDEEDEMSNKIDVYGLWVLLIFGCTFAVLSLLIEILSEASMKKRLQNYRISALEYISKKLFKT